MAEREGYIVRILIVYKSSESLKAQYVISALTQGRDRRCRSCSHRYTATVTEENVSPCLRLSFIHVSFISRLPTLPTMHPRH